MCRIAGFFGEETTEKHFSVVSDMIELLKHGGPDNQSVKNIDSVIFGHARLSILDLSESANQPFEWNGYTICYNGEIYNFQQIKTELKMLGYNFSTDSDTEVIVKSYDAWGIKFVERFKGMFAFAIWDKRKEQLILVRDRVGVKPLFYLFHNNGIYFFSELKAIKAIPDFSCKINHSVLPDFLQKGYINGANCIFHDVYKVPAASILIFDKKMRVTSSCFWKASEVGVENFKGDYELGKKRVQEELIKTVALRMVSDVPVGIFLSGGVDSSLVTAIAARELGASLKTFTVSFEDPKFNEAVLAKSIAHEFNTDHYEFKCNEEALLEFVDEIPLVYDEPFADASALPTLFLSAQTKKYVKVSLGGDGGDEVFGGYVKYEMTSKFHYNRIKYRLIGLLMNLIGDETAIKLGEQLLKNRYTNIGTKVRKFIYASRAKNSFDFFNRSSDFIDTKRLLQIFPEKDYPLQTISEDSELQKGKIVRAMGVSDINNYLLDDLLVKVDRASMRYGLEAREPLLDHNLIELGLSLPDSWKLKSGTTKYILRDILKNYLPTAITDAPKSGFSVPLETWLRYQLVSQVKQMQYDDEFFQKFKLNQSLVSSMIDSFYENKTKVDPQFIWNIFMLYKWSLKWLAK